MKTKTLKAVRLELARCRRENARLRKMLSDNLTPAMRRSYQRVIETADGPAGKPGGQ